MVRGPLRRRILQEVHRAQVINRILRRLNYLRGGEDRYCPAVWMRVAAGLGIAVLPCIGTINNSRARLRHCRRKEVWIIEYDITRNDILICHYLVHELAHYFQRAFDGEWLCDEEVYFYEGGGV